MTDAPDHKVILAAAATSARRDLFEHPEWELVKARLITHGLDAGQIDWFVEDVCIKKLMSDRSFELPKRLALVSSRLDALTTACALLVDYFSAAPSLSDPNRAEIEGAYANLGWVSKYLEVQRQQTLQVISEQLKLAEKVQKPSETFQRMMLESTHRVFGQPISDTIAAVTSILYPEAKSTKESVDNVWSRRNRSLQSPAASEPIAKRRKKAI